MKYLIILLTVLSSCSSGSHHVMLSNGSIVPAVDYHNRRFEAGDTVCVISVNAHTYSIDSRGNMKDTTEMMTQDGVLNTFRYRIGVIR